MKRALNDLELEKKRLMVKLMESTSCVKELKIEKEFFENKVKILVSNFEKSNAQFPSFSSDFKKLTKS